MHYFLAYELRRIYKLGVVIEMKKSIQITGLPVISISEGNQVGKIKSLVINPEKGSVDFLTIEHEDLQVSAKAIPFKKIVGIGEYAVTIENENAIIDLNEIPIANQLVNRKIKIKNTKVLTRKGELLGEAKEYFIDQETGNILGMEIKVNDDHVILSSPYVVTFGKDIIIVKEDASSYFLQSPEDLENENGLQEIAATAEEVSNVEEEETGDKDLQVLKEKQIELLNGKELLKDIYNKDGVLLFPAGTILTPEHIKKAQEEGPSVFVELSMSVKA